MPAMVQGKVEKFKKRINIKHRENNNGRKDKKKILKRVQGLPCYAQPLYDVCISPATFARTTVTVSS